MYVVMVTEVNEESKRGYFVGKTVNCGISFHNKRWHWVTPYSEG